VKRALRNLLLLFALGIRLPATAQAPSTRELTAQESELLTAADEGDLALMDLLDRSGDDLALRGLDPEAPDELRLAAIRACPTLEAPEACLPALAQEAVGRDPDLAPAASLALFEIGRRLSADQLARRESSTPPLVELATSLDASLEQASLRPDLAQLIGLAAASLRAATTDGAPEGS
jgi:hypothetical protein